MFAASALVRGLVAGTVSLGILAVRAAMDGQSGVAFADLWTALAVGIAVGIVALVLANLSAWRSRPGGRWGHAGGVATARASVSPSGSAASRKSPRSGSRHMDRFDKFTDRARKVLTLAQDEAQRFNHNYIGTEHLLLGLVREGEGIAAGVLESLGVNLDKVRHEVIRVLATEQDPA